jgi:hypothetical protein
MRWCNADAELITASRELQQQAADCDGHVGIVQYLLLGFSGQDDGCIPGIATDSLAGCHPLIAYEVPLKSKAWRHCS